MILQHLLHLLDRNRILGHCERFRKAVVIGVVAGIDAVDARVGEQPDLRVVQEDIKTAETLGSVARRERVLNSADAVGRLEHVL